MGTPREQILNRLRESRGEDPQEPRESQRPSVLETLRQTRTDDGISVLSQLRARRGVEEPESERGFLASLGAGAAEGLLEPLGFIPSVGDFLSRLEEGEPEDGTLAGTIGHGLGFLAGFAIPSAGALKLGGLATKGLKLVKTADAFADLGATGNAVRGAVAGGILGAGRSAEDTRDRTRNILQEAALFGIGDVVAFPIMRGIAAVNPLGKSSSKAAEKLRGFVDDDGVIGSEEGAKLMGRALQAADELFPEEVLAQEGIRKRRANLKLGIAELPLTQLRSGEMRIVPSMQAKGDDISQILSQLDEIDHAVVPRTIGDEQVSDILVARAGSLDERAVETYRRNAEETGVGWIPGQNVLWKGSKRTILGKGNKPGIIKMKTVGSDSKPFFRSIKDVQPLPVANWTLGPAEVKEAPRMWASFLEQFGEFPEQGFNDAFEAFVRENDISDGPQVDALREFFTGRQVQLLNDLDPKTAGILQNLRNTLPDEHVEGELREIAAQSGFVLGEAQNAEGQWVFELRDAFSGARRRFPNQARVRNHLETIGRDLPDLLPDNLKSPLVMEGLGPQGAQVQKPHTAIELNNIDLPWGTHVAAAFNSLLPRRQFIREMDDIITREAPEVASELRIFERWERLQNGLTQSKNQAAPWFERLTEIRGGKGKSRIRREAGPYVSQLMETPESDWANVIAGSADALGKGLTKDEVQVARDLKDYFDDIFKVLRDNDQIDIDAEDFLQNYFPHIRRLSPENWERSVRDSFSRRGDDVSEKTIKFIHEMERTGTPPGRMELDPFVVATRYTRSAHSKIHMFEPLKDMKSLLTELPTEGTAGIVRRALSDYVHLVANDTPEAFPAMRAAFDDILMKKLDLDLDENTFDKLVTNFASLNYGAFMGFRPGLALRNLSQLIMTTAPMTGYTWLSEGMKVYAKGGQAAKRELIDEGVIQAGQAAFHLQDEIYLQGLNEATKGSSSGKALTKFLGTAKRFSDMSLGGSVEIAGREIPIGLYNRSDEVNRVVSYFAQKRKTLNALNKWKGPQGHGDIAKFNEQSGLSMLGESITEAFHRKLTNEGEIAAAKWAGKQLADDTQFVYQLGAGPARFSHGVGKLFGMYGTFPSWYVAHLRRGLTRGTGRDKAKFMARSAAAMGAVGTAGYTAGVNVSTWIPLNSLAWAGGPAFDYFKDVTDIVSGSFAGQASPGRQLALAERGIRDRGGALPVPGGSLDPRRGVGLDIVDPQKLFWSVIEPFTPGALARKDFMETIQADTGKERIIRALGLNPVPGHAWPEMNP